MATKAQILANTRLELKIDPLGNIWGDTQINGYTDDFVSRVYSEIKMDFKELTANLTLVASTATYALTALTNYGKLTSIRLTGRTSLLEKKDKLDLENTVDLTEEGEPQYFYEYGDNTIGLWPVPDGVITTASVNYERSAPTLASNESPAFDSSFHYVIPLYNKWRCLANIPGFELQARTAKETYDQHYAMMREKLWERDTGLTTFKRTSNPICLPQ